MSKKILQINFNYTLSEAEVASRFEHAAKAIAETPGLRSKTWLHDAANKAAGGHYVFDDQKSVDGYLNGPIVAKLKSSDAFTNVSVKIFDTVDGLNAVTRGATR